MIKNRYTWITAFGLALTSLTFFAHATEAYTKIDNNFIWKARLSAQTDAQDMAYVKCQWRPNSYPMPNDMILENNRHKNQALYTELMHLLRLDQNARYAMQAWPNELTKQNLKMVDATNLVSIKKIMAQQFPSTTLVGDQGANAFLVLVAHADRDRTFQRKALNRLVAAANHGDVPPFFPAVLKSIRPEIVGGHAPKPERPTPSPAHSTSKAESGGECFRDHYRHAFRVNLKTLLASHFSPS